MTTNKLLVELRAKALEMLKDLPSNITYHNMAHTIDVMRAAERIARSEMINDNDIELLLTAAVFHDLGYIVSRHEHEEESCRIAQRLLGEGGVGQGDIDVVCRLIRATKVPHQPLDRLSEILCDADLDYLGRDDFFETAHKVFTEFRTFGVVKDENEWNKLQIRFLESHKYFSPTAIRTRQQKKLEHIEKLKEIVNAV